MYIYIYIYIYMYIYIYIYINIYMYIYTYTSTCTSWHVERVVGRVHIGGLFALVDIIVGLFTVVQCAANGDNGRKVLGVALYIYICICTIHVNECVISHTSIYALYIYIYIRTCPVGGTDLSRSGYGHVLYGGGGVQTRPLYGSFGVGSIPPPPYRTGPYPIRDRSVPPMGQIRNPSGTGPYPIRNRSVPPPTDQTL